jgi:hypothetical protein
MSIAVEYRFLWTESPSWDSDYYYYGNYDTRISFGQIKSQSLSLAFRYRF